MSATLKNMFVKSCFTFALLSMLISPLQAQDWEAGIWVGTANYIGDLNPKFNLDNPSQAYGALVRYNFNKRLSLKFSGNYGTVVGNDAFSEDIFQRERNLNFESDIYDATLQFEFNFLKYVHGSEDHGFTPYLLGGVSLFSFNPTTTYEGQTYDLQPLGTENQFRGNEYALTQFALAFGGGIKFDLSFEWSINIEISARKLFTDYLDDVSGTYPDMEDLEEARGDIAVILSDRSFSNISEPGRQRGNSQINDSYVFLGVGLVYNFARINCPWF